jgi:hypothetical protein
MIIKRLIKWLVRAISVFLPEAQSHELQRRRHGGRACCLNDPNTFKVRKAKVGVYRDYFDDEQVVELNALVDANLLPVFGYTSAEAGCAR